MHRGALQTSHVLSVRRGGADANYCEGNSLYDLTHDPNLTNIDMIRVKIVSVGLLNGFCLITVTWLENINGISL